MNKYPNEALAFQWLDRSSLTRSRPYLFIISRAPRSFGPSADFTYLSLYTECLARMPSHLESHSSPHVLEFQRVQGQMLDGPEDKCQLVSNVAAIGPDLRRERPDIACLNHADDQRIILLVARSVVGHLYKFLFFSLGCHWLCCED